MRRRWSQNSPDTKPSNATVRSASDTISRPPIRRVASSLAWRQLAKK